MLPTLTDKRVNSWHGIFYKSNVNQKLLEQAKCDITVYKLINFSVIHLSAMWMIKYKPSLPTIDESLNKHVFRMLYIETSTRKSCKWWLTCHIFKKLFLKSDLKLQFTNYKHISCLLSNWHLRRVSMFLSFSSAA